MGKLFLWICAALVAACLIMTPAYLRIEQQTARALTIIPAPGGAAGSAAWGSITGTLSAQTDLGLALDARCLESVFGTSIGTGLALDGTALKVSTILQKYHGVDPSANVLTVLGCDNNAAINSALGTGTEDSPQFTGIELGHGTDTTLTRVSAGVVAIEGNNISTLGANISEAEISLTDITTNNTSTTQHGFFPKITAWRLPYSNATAIAQATLGANGTFLESNGVDQIPAFRALEAADIPDISATYQPILTNEAGLYTALSDVTNFLQDNEKFTGQVTVQAFGADDATPDVSNAALGVNNVYQTANANPTTITDFDDVDDHSEFADGDWFILRVDDANTTIDFSENANIEGNAGVDFTGSATQIVYLLFIYEDARWNCMNFTAGYSDPTTLAVSAMDLTGGSLTIPTVAGDLTLTSGKIGVDSTQAQFGYHDGTREVAIPSIQVIQLTVDPGAWYDSDAEIWLLDLFADRFPDGIVITKWYVDANVADPDVEMDLNLMYCDAVAGAAFPGANPVLIDVMDTTTGNSSETDMSNSDLTSGVIPTGKSLYLLFDADPEGTCTQLSVKIYYYIPES